MREKEVPEKCIRIICIHDIMLCILELEPKKKQMYPSGRTATPGNLPKHPHHSLSSGYGCIWDKDR